MAKIPNESDVLAQNAKLTADLTASTSALETANASAATLTAKVTALEANLAEVTGKLSKVEGDLASANASLAAKETELQGLKATAAKLEVDNKVLGAKEQDLQKRVAVELAAKGIRSGAIASAPESSGGKPNLTEQCLAARSK